MHAIVLNFEKQKLLGRRLDTVQGRVIRTDLTPQRQALVIKSPWVHRSRGDQNDRPRSLLKKRFF